MHGKLHIPENAGESRMVADAGQSVISIVFILVFFLLGLLGFAVDLTNIWSHRQAAVAAADAACQAGAMDSLATAAGETLNSTGFTAGTASNCVDNPSATMCFYANQNGYSGAGLVSGSASSSVSWTFPQSVNGVTAGGGTYPFMQVSIAENVKTYLMGLVKGANYLTINVTSTCGTAQVLGAAPMVVLNPTMSGAFKSSGQGTLEILGGPSRGLQVNSSSATAYTTGQNQGLIDLSQGGPNQTGSSVGIAGATPMPSSNGSTYGFEGGTTGSWQNRVMPVLDPYGSVNVPASVKTQIPSVNAKSVAYGVDGCPDHSFNCYEYGPGYYPSGINFPTNYQTIIFLPGVYYLNGSMTSTGSNTLRVARPSGYVATQGVMFYFYSGSLNIAGGSSGNNIDSVSSSSLTCDGSAPPSALNMPSTLSGNVLWGQCTANGTYVDSGGDTSDTYSSSGSRGLLVFQDHANSSQTTFAGSGKLAFSGAVYCHQSGYGAVLNISGAGTSGTYLLGEIVVDQVVLSGSGTIKLALSSANTTPLSKVGVFN